MTTRLHTKSEPPKVELDWSRLLGFDQAVRSAETAATDAGRRLLRLGTKIGVKEGRSSQRR